MFHVGVFSQDPVWQEMENTLVSLLAYGEETCTAGDICDSVLKWRKKGINHSRKVVYSTLGKPTRKFPHVIGVRQWMMCDAIIIILGPDPDKAEEKCLRNVYSSPKTILFAPEKLQRKQLHSTLYAMNQSLEPVSTQPSTICATNKEGVGNIGYLLQLLRKITEIAADQQMITVRTGEEVNEKNTLLNLENIEVQAVN
jgi:hypothetical protein